jgi:hypothetical protein
MLASGMDGNSLTVAYHNSPEGSSKRNTISTLSVGSVKSQADDEDVACQSM